MTAGRGPSCHASSLDQPICCCLQVNQRLQASESEDEGGDPAFPKQQVMLYLIARAPRICICLYDIDTHAEGVLNKILRVCLRVLVSCMTLKFMRLQWPTEALCPRCRLPRPPGETAIAWNLDEVYSFLQRFYQGSSPEAALRSAPGTNQASSSR